VVGINTAIFTRSGFSSGIGFAIPINTVKRIVPQLIANGVVSLPSLNVQLASAKVGQPLTPRDERGAARAHLPHCASLYGAPHPASS
jgi:S1-C subfamily serine protease